MEKQYTYEEISQIINTFVESNSDKGPWYVIGTLQAHLTMALTGVDKEDIVKQLTKKY